MNRFALLATVLVGCTVEESVSGPQLLVPDEVLVDWDVSLNGVDDGLVALVPVDVMVYDSQSGEPLYGMQLDLVGDAPDTLLVAADDVQPAATIDGESLSDIADTTWDAWRDRYVSLDPSTLTEHLTVQTDATGLARVYVLIDRFADDPSGGVSVASVTVSTDDIEQSLVLRPR